MALTEHPIDLTPPRDPICPGVSFTVHLPWVRTVVMSAPHGCELGSSISTGN